MGLLSLGIDPGNIISLFTLLSPFFISMFFIFQGALQGSLSGIFWLFGVLIAQWGIGFFIVRTAFARKQTYGIHNKFSKLIEKGISPKEAYNKLKGKSSSRSWRIKKEGSNVSSFSDMCSIFLHPYSNSIYTQFSMPSLNSIFHAFTIVYVACCAFSTDGSQQQLSSTIFVITLSFIFLLHTFSSYKKKCNTMMDILVGTLIGGASGACWYYAVKGMSDSFYPDKKNSLLLFKDVFVAQGGGKCQVQDQAFRCSYDTSGFPEEDKVDDDDDE